MADPNTANHASEGGHWYTRDGQQVVGVPYAASNRAKAGQLRAPTLRDARANDWAPGVTTIIRQAYAPQLELWKINQAILATATLPRVEGETDDEWLARIHTDRQEHAKQAAEEGTRIHAAVQDFIGTGAVHPSYKAHIRDVDRLLDELFDEDWLIDFKGTDKAWDRLQTYPAHWMQLAATRRALLEHGTVTFRWHSEVECAHPMGYGTKADLFRGSPADARCAIVYIHREHGEASLHEISRDQEAQGWMMFKALHAYWCAANMHFPWTKEDDR